MSKRTEDLVEVNRLLKEDIAARRRTEQMLTESERRFRTLTESLPQLVWTCKPDGWCDYLSKQWLDYTGRPEPEQLGFGWLDRYSLLVVDEIGSLPPERHAANLLFALVARRYE